MLEFLRWAGLPEVASAHGQQIDQLISWVHVLMAALFIGWGVFFILALIKFRHGANPKANYAGVKTHVSTYFEVAVAVIEVILLVGISIPVWSKVVVNVPEESEADNVVRIVAQQFQWNIHYPGPDGVFGKADVNLMDDQSNPLGLDRNDPAGVDDIWTINQLHLVVNEPVLIELSSKDVIHSFSLPIMRVKQDVIPGMRIPLSFTPIKIGDSEIACAQLCGLGHYRMRGFLSVQNQADYDAWMQEELEYILPQDEEPTDDATNTEPTEG